MHLHIYMHTHTYTRALHSLEQNNISSETARTHIIYTYMHTHTHKIHTGAPLTSTKQHLIRNSAYTYPAHIHTHIHTQYTQAHHSLEQNNISLETARTKLEQARSKRSYLAAGVFSREVEQLVILSENTEKLLHELHTERDGLEREAELLRFRVRTMQVRICMYAFDCAYVFAGMCICMYVFLFFAGCMCVYVCFA
jgi:hypothetical protein